MSLGVPRAYRVPGVCRLRHRSSAPTPGQLHSRYTRGRSEGNDSSCAVGRRKPAPRCRSPVDWATLSQPHFRSAARVGAYAGPTVSMARSSGRFTAPGRACPWARRVVSLCRAGHVRSPGTGVYRRGSASGPLTVGGRHPAARDVSVGRMRRLDGHRNRCSRPDPAFAKEGLDQWSSEDMSLSAGGSVPILGAPVPGSGAGRAVFDKSRIAGSVRPSKHGANMGTKRAHKK